MEYLVLDSLSGLAELGTERRTMQASGQKRKVCIAVGCSEVENGGVKNVLIKISEVSGEGGVGRLGLLLLTLVLGSCANTELPSMPSMSPSESKEYPIYTVTMNRAPFYLKNSPNSMGGKKSLPYLYLSKGMTVSMMKNAQPFSKVSLINGMQGWMPISVLAPQMAKYEGEGTSAVSPAAGQGATGASPAEKPPKPARAVKLPSYY
ncbi:MAG: hypothetical protein QM496_02570 [Verrucomicrobiota bacterium]